MKRIYNKVYLAAMAALMLTIATACTAYNEPMQDNDTPQTGRPVTITATHPGAGTQDGTDAQTRTNHEESGGGVKVTWKTGDKIYIGNAVSATGSLADNNFEEFELVGEGGKTTGTFTNASSNLDMNKTLYAVYGKEDKISFVEEQVGPTTDVYAKFDLTGQCQTSDGNMAHIADYDFMVAEANSGASLAFRHTAALVKFNLTLPENDITVNKLELKLKHNSSGVQYEALYSDYKCLFSSTTSGGGTYTDVITIDLNKNPEFTSTDNKVTVYMMVRRSGELSATATITVTGTDDKTYSGKVNGIEKLTDGEFHTITATLTEQQQ